jgi:hypothetical protein
MATTSKKRKPTGQPKPASRRSAARQTKAAASRSAKKRNAKRSGARRAAAAAPKSKSMQMLEHLQRPEGATLNELMALSGWQAHSVRGFLSGTVRKRLNLPLHSDVKDDTRRYRIEPKDRADRASS